jgi:hypothetical protein
MIDERQVELFDEAVLKVLEANNTQFGLGTDAIGTLVRQFGFKPGAAELVETLEYLQGKRLVREAPKVIAKALRNWKITDAGREYLDLHNV